MKQSNLFQQNRNKNEGNNLESLHLVERQIKILRYLGIILSDKNKFVICSLTFLAYTTIYMILYGGFVHYWGNIKVITEIIYEIIVVTYSFIIRLYILFNQNKFLVLFTMVDIEFTRFINKSVSSENKEKIISKVKKQSKSISNTFLVIFIAVMLTWTCMGFIVRIIDRAAGITIEDGDARMYKYFCVVAWVPENVLNSHLYELFYLHQVISVTVAVLHYSASNIIFFFFIYYTTAHFELLISCIEDIDVKFPEENLDVSEDYSINSKKINSMNKSQMEDSFKGSSQDSKPREVEWVESNKLVIGNISDIENCRIDHLIDCIKYHQAILE